jgi:hypothetical protein
LYTSPLTTANKSWQQQRSGPHLNLWLNTPLTVNKLYESNQQSAMLTLFCQIHDTASHAPEPVAEHACEGDAPEVLQILNARMAAVQRAPQRSSSSVHASAALHATAITNAMN